MEIFFDNWQTLFRTFVITILAYLAMIFLLRVSGKRTLSKMNAFDFIVTIALGSTLATISLSKEVALAEGVLAFFLLMFLQYAITWLSVRSKKVKNLITNSPALLLYKGELNQKVLKRERITREELNVSLRKKGVANLNDIEIIVLETTGEMTIVLKAQSSVAEILKDVKQE